VIACYRASPTVPPPPCGEGSGVGVTHKGNDSGKYAGPLPRNKRRSLPRLHPTPNPSPSRGGESGRAGFAVPGN